MSERWQRVSALLDELFELEPPRRAARLARIAADDAALAAELERLLSADERSGVLDGGVAQVAPTVLTRLAGTGEGTARAASAAGRRIGHYVLLERVGSGGMGEVWRANRVDDFEQQVAIKLIRPLLDSPSLRERFARERRILARLDHPAIARMIDGGIDDDGVPWYAMEFVQGEPLVRHAESRALDLRTRVQLLLQVCDAVAHAHAQLVIHRDIKPSNLLVDVQGRARVLDFGIARLLDDSLDPALTGTGVRVYSPAYAAPEQIRGEAVGTAADVFALGAVLFELLTGRVPHPQRSASADRLLVAIAQETAPRPSQAGRDTEATPSGSRPTRVIDPDLDLIVATALQPEPARRYAGAAQLADDLRRWLDGRPIAAQPDTASYRLRKFVTRHRVAVGSASAVLLALLAGLAIALWQAQVAREHARRADAEARRAQLQAERADRVRGFLLTLFREQDPLTRAKAKAATAGELIERGIREAQRDFAADPALQAEIINELAEIQFNLGDVKPTREHLERVLELRRSAEGERSIGYAAALSDLGGTLLALGERDAAREAIERSAVLLREVAGLDHIETAVADSRMVRSLLEQGRGEEALQLTERVIATFTRERGPDHVETVRRLYNRGVVLEQLDRLDEAEAVLRDVLARYERGAGADHVQNVYPRVVLADVLRRKRRYADAAEVYTQALVTARASLDDTHPVFGNIQMRLGDLYRRLRRYDEAVEALDAAERVLAPLGGPELGQVYVYRGQLASQRERPAEGVEWYGRALAHYRRALGETSIYTLGARLSLARLRVENGEVAAGLAEARAASADLLAVSAPGQFEQAFAHENLADVMVAAGLHAEALPHLREALDVSVGLYGTEHGSVATLQWSIGAALFATGGDLAEARDLLDHALATMRREDDSSPDIGEALLTLARVRAALGQAEAAADALAEARTRLERDYGAQHRLSREAAAETLAGGAPD